MLLVLGTNYTREAPAQFILTHCMTILGTSVRESPVWIKSMEVPYCNFEMCICNKSFTYVLRGLSVSWWEDELSSSLWGCLVK